MNFNTSNFNVGLSYNIPPSYIMANAPAFDPHSMLLKRIADKKKIENGEMEIKIEEYNNDDVKALEEFCFKHGILGFNFKNMNPRAALQMLKGKIGYIEPKVEQIKSEKTLLKG